MQKIARADRDEVLSFRRGGRGSPLTFKQGREVETPKALLVKLVRSMQGKTRHPGVDMLIKKETGATKGGERFELYLNDRERLVLRVYLHLTGIRKLVKFDYELAEVPPQ